MSSEAAKDPAKGPAKGPASYFPAIEKRYGRPIGAWQQIVRDRLPAKHMELVALLKAEHGMGHGHANAVVAHVLAEHVLAEHVPAAQVPAAGEG